jgi:phage gp29-like protein
MAESVRLYDAYDRPVNLAALRREHAAPQVAGVRTVWQDTVASGLTPKRLAALIRRADDADHHDYLTLAEEIEERDGHYRSVLGTRKLAVAGLEPVVEAASDAARDVELADAVRELARAPDFGELVGNLLDALGKGFSAVEINWQAQDGRWLPRFAWRDPRFFQWDRDTRSQLRIRDVADGVNGLPLPPYKFIVHRPRLKTGLPIRGGLARPAAWAYLFKAFSIKDWAAFLEVYGFPLRVGRYGDGATDDDIRKLMSAVVNLGSDAAAVIHKSMEIEFQDAVGGGGQGGAAMFEKAAEFWDKQLSKVILGQTASTEGTPGKLGNDQAQSDVRADILKADAAQVSATLNRDLVKPYIDLNFGPPSEGAYPRLSLHVPEPEDLVALTTALRDLVPLGLRVEQSVIRDKLGLPEPEEGAELLAPPPAPAPPPMPGEEGATAAARLCPQCGHVHSLALAQADAGSGFDDLDEIEAEALAEWEPMMRPLIDPIRELIQRSGSYEELVAGLEALLGQMDAQRLMRDLGAALFKARGAGEGRDV